MIQIEVMWVGPQRQSLLQLKGGDNVPLASLYMKMNDITGTQDRRIREFTGLQDPRIHRITGSEDPQDHRITGFAGSQD